MTETVVNSLMPVERTKAIVRNMSRTSALPTTYAAPPARRPEAPLCGVRHGPRVPGDRLYCEPGYPFSGGACGISRGHAASLQPKIIPVLVSRFHLRMAAVMLSRNVGSRPPIRQHVNSVRHQHSTTEIGVLADRPAIWLVLRVRIIAIDRHQPLPVIV